MDVKYAINEENIFLETCIKHAMNTQNFESDLKITVVESARINTEYVDSGSNGWLRYSSAVARILRLRLFVWDLVSWPSPSSKVFKLVNLLSVRIAAIYGTFSEFGWYALRSSCLYEDGSGIFELPVILMAIM